MPLTARRLLLVLAALMIWPAVARAEGSITDRLTADHTAVEVTSEPAGTAYVHVAAMRNLAGEGVVYYDVPASQTRIAPAAERPVLDVQAFTSSKVAIGGWAGRLQTTDAPVEPPPPSSMIVSLDAGGWDWESAVSDFSKAVRYVRSSASNYASTERVSRLQAHGVKLLPLFNEWSVGNLVPWFQRWGRPAGARTAELVNEPGNPFFWGSGAQTDQPRYAALIEEAHRALEALPAAERPRLLVSFDGGYEGDAYGRRLIADDPHLLQLGLGWTVHPYGGHGTSSAEGNRPRVTEAEAATHQPVYVTEVGWPTAVGQPATGDSLQWTEQQQAANIESFVTWAHGLGYVSDVTVFNYADYGSNDWYGIVDRTGTRHKLSFSTLAGLTATLGAP